MLTIAGKSPGSRKPLFDDFSIPPPPDVGDGSDPPRLRDLIAYVVRQEVQKFEHRQAAGRLDRILSARQIEQGLERGRVSPEGRDIDQKADPDEAVASALQAFEDGMYLVVIDEEEHRNLDAFVHITADSRLTFIRLTFLAGA